MRMLLGLGRRIRRWLLGRRIRRRLGLEDGFEDGLEEGFEDGSKKTAPMVDCRLE
jgi:hypothetical protein